MKVKELLVKKENWTQNELALNSEKKPVAPGSKKAVCWCLLGAVQKCYHSRLQRDRVYELIDNHIFDNSLEYCIAGWNDAKERKFSEVKKLVNKLDI